MPDTKRELSAEEFYVNSAQPKIHPSDKTQVFAFAEAYAASLRAEVEELRNERDADDRDWKQIALAFGSKEETREEIVKYARQLLQRVESAEARSKALEEALIKYSRHAPNCDITGNAYKRNGTKWEKLPCNCGLQDILNKAESLLEKRL
jgi:undecaprenyl pyrophosphate synthase